MSKKVLYISDSLGTPIHARGIYYYSLALVEMLRDLGCDMTLLVEMPTGFSAPGLFKKKKSFLGEDSFISSEVYRYFWQREYGISFELRELPKGSSVFSYMSRFLDRVAHSIRKVFFRKVLFFCVRRLRRWGFFNVKNAMLRCKNVHCDSSLKGVRGDHLNNFDSFLCSDFFYTDSVGRAVNNLPAPSVDASGYDLVVIDTPHYVSVKNIERKNIFSVVHDLIPVRDYSTNDEWRFLFIKKLMKTLSHTPNMIFVSEVTRSLFKKELPHVDVSNSSLIYPTIRNTLIKSSVEKEENERFNYNMQLPKRRKKAFKNSFAEGPSKKISKLIKDSEWNPDLPCFSTALSDEPRKNVSLLVELSQRMQGKINIIIMGKVDGNSYMKHQPWLFPNLHFTGYVSDEVKSEIFRNSEGIIFPSLAEGFGIPIVEGALYKVPVLCSNIPVFREIVQGNASLFDPYNVSDLERVVLNFLAHREHYKNLARRLYPQLLARFSQDAMRNVIATNVLDFKG